MFAASLPFVAAGLGCSKLTSPPEPEPISSDTITVAPIPRGSAPAAPTLHPLPNRLPAASASAAEPAGQLKIDDLVVGKGPEVKNGDTISVHYVGTLLDGTKFDASRDHGNQPFTLQIPGRVIEGWNKGIPGMRVGGKRKLTIPPQMAYGPRGSPPRIPPNATLVFEIELMEIKSPGPAAPNAPH
jgi:hypothetical protein